MYCSNCGKELRENERFCEACGTKQESTDENNVIVFEREGGQIPFNKFVEITIDGDKSFRVNPGEQVKVELSEGRHIVKSSLRLQKVEEIIVVPDDEKVIIALSSAHMTIKKRSGTAQTKESEKSNSEQIQHVPEVKVENTNAAAEKPKYSYPATIRNKKGIIDIYEDRISLVFGAENSTIYYTEIDRIDQSLGQLLICTKGEQIYIGLPQGVAKQLAPTLANMQLEILKVECPERVFEESYGQFDQILINQKYGTFCVKHKGVSGPVYNLKDVIQFEIQELEKGGDALTGALVGNMIAGKSGAVLGAMSASSSGEIEYVDCSIVIKTNGTPIALHARLVAFVIAAAKSSQKYQDIKAVELKLESIIRPYVNQNNMPVQEVKSESKIDVADEIRKFKALYDEGILTQEEYELKKKELLGL